MMCHDAMQVEEAQPDLRRLNLMCRPLAPGRYNITFSLKGFANEMVTVDVPEDETGTKLDVYLQPLGNSVINWGLARKFGPLNSMRPAADSSLVISHASLQVLGPTVKNTLLLTGFLQAALSTDMCVICMVSTILTSVRSLQRKILGLPGLDGFSGICPRR